MIRQPQSPDKARRNQTKKNYESPNRTPGTKFVYSGAIDDTDGQILRIAQVLLKTVLKAVLRPVFG